jgi:hypothetical protein
VTTIWQVMPIAPNKRQRIEIKKERESNLNEQRARSESPISNPIGNHVQQETEIVDLEEQASKVLQHQLELASYNNNVITNAPNQFYLLKQPIERQRKSYHNENR